MTTIAETIQKAVDHHRAGHLDQAGELYGQILQDEPENPIALHSMGTLAYQSGRYDEAVDWLSRAVEANRSIAQFHNTLGIALEAAGKPQDAIDAYHHAILLKPDFAEAYSNMAIALLSQDRFAEAARKCERAIQLAPDFAVAHNTMGFCLEKQGMLAQAAESYKQALRLRPDFAEAFNHLGVVLTAQNRLDEAIDCFIEAANLEPDYAEAYYNLGIVLAKEGQLDEAIASYQRALEIEPKLVGAYNRLGIALNERGQHGEAIKNFRRALKHRPDYIEVYNNLGIALQDQGKYSQAVDEYLKASQLGPGCAEIHYNLGNALQLLGRHEEAAENYRLGLGLKPDYAQAYNNLGISLKEQGLYDEAVQSCEQAIRLEPDCSQFYSNLASILQHQGRAADAVANCERAISLEPDNTEAYFNLASVLRDCGRLDEAVQKNSRAIQLRPDYAEAHWNQAITYLLKGDFKEGWREFQWRRKTDWHTNAYPHKHRKPRWKGGRFTGKKLLVHCEQGLGDCIQFIRYLPMVKSLGGSVIFEAWKSLHGLLKDFRAIDELVELSFEKGTEAHFDAHVSVMDLPGIFKTDERRIPRSVPYLLADPAKAEYWRKTLTGPDFKVGIVWAGSARHANDRNRSCKLETFAPVSKIKGVKLYGLQKGEPAREVGQSAHEIEIENLGEHLVDFTDTAAVIQNMDLIISVDTATLHLAGAMGRPVWALLALAPDWRWMLDRRDSPWYPTMRLFRQKEWGNWDSVLEQCEKELKTLAGKRSVTECNTSK